MVKIYQKVGKTLIKCEIHLDLNDPRSNLEFEMTSLDGLVETRTKDLTIPSRRLPISNLYLLIFSLVFQGSIASK